jgi:hypothetical protein
VKRQQRRSVLFLEEGVLPARTLQGSPQAQDNRAQDDDRYAKKALRYEPFRAFFHLAHRLSYFPILGMDGLRVRLEIPLLSKAAVSANANEVAVQKRDSGTRLPPRQTHPLAGENVRLCLFPGHTGASGT